MDFRTAQPIIDACKVKAEEGIWGYTSRPDSYFEAYAGWQKRRNGWTIDTSLCSWSLGVVPALAALVKLFTGPNDKVLIQPPVYPEFYEVTEMVGRRVAEKQHGADRERLGGGLADFERKAKDPLVKMFILCSPPQSPGKGLTREELERMLDICFCQRGARGVR